MAAVAAVTDISVCRESALQHPGRGPSPALQLLLRFLPFTRAGSQQPTAQQAAHAASTRQRLLDELHKNPLWRLASHADSCSTHILRPAGRVQHSLPHEVQDALMSYVRLAAEEDQRQRPAPGSTHHHRRSGPASPLEVAAELQALYSLAVSNQQQQQQQRRAASSSNEALSDAQILQLFKAYVSLQEDGQGGRPAAAGGGHHHRHHKQGSWDDNAAAAAAVQALYAFVQLAESADQQQQQPPPAAGQLARVSGTAAAAAAGPSASDKQAGSSGSSGGGPSGGTISSCKDSSSDLQVLLKLAQLSPA